jgi:hypothetical protein
MKFPVATYERDAMIQELDAAAPLCQDVIA